MIWYDTASIYLELNKPNKAIPSFQKVLELDPTHADAHFELATAYYLNGQKAQALDLLVKAIKLDAGKKDLVKDAFPKFFSNEVIRRKLGIV